MPESVATADRDNNVEDDCPLCLDPLPPFWEQDGRVNFYCCGKAVCNDCNDKQLAVLNSALADGSYGNAEKQLGGHCPMCRASLPGEGCGAIIMQGKLEDGCLPLHFYRELGMCYLDGEEGVGRSVERGIELLMLGAEKGDPSCQDFIGKCYQMGDYGLPISVDDAKRWLLAATEQGHAIAEYEFARLLRDEGNDAECLRYLRGSASKGHDNACFVLGRCCYFGQQGAKKSTEEAIRVLTPAAERGHAKSMALLGHAMCSDDEGRMAWPTSNPTFVQGVHWLRRAAEKGDEKAVTGLAALEEVVSSMCFMCDKKTPPDHKFLRCSRCCAAWYCSKDCQVQHWKAEGGHKQFCIKRRPQK